MVSLTRLFCLHCQGLILLATLLGPLYGPVEAAGEDTHAGITSADRDWWSFQPIVRTKPPWDEVVAGVPWHPIDAFLHQRLAVAGLSPSPLASRRELVRRVYADLIGLPPSPEIIDAFVADESPDAFEKLVDRLLASPYYGERWGRHWLDLVRFGQTNGYERDAEKPNAWRYRDYVVRSFNEDKTYDRFVVEQLAGDELDDATNDSIIATGFYRVGSWDDEPDDKQVAYYDELDDIVRVTANTFLGLTIGCARCHEHKFDPIPQEDYYRLLAFFRNVTPYGRDISSTHYGLNPDAVLTPLVTPTGEAKWAVDKARIRQEVSAAKDKLAVIYAAAVARQDENPQIARLDTLRSAFAVPPTERSTEQNELVVQATANSIPRDQLVMWLDASDPDGDSDPSNNPTPDTAITQWSDAHWKDKTNSGNDAVLGARLSESGAPSLEDSLADLSNSQPALWFDGFATGLDTPLRANPVQGDIPAPQFTVVAVVRAVADDTYRSIWTFDGATGGHNRGLGVQEGQFKVQAGGPTISAPAPAQDWCIISVTFDYPNGVTLAVNDNKSISSVGEIPTVHDNAMTLGYFPVHFTAEGTQHLEGQLAEVLVYRRTLEDKEQARLRGFLAAKYGLLASVYAKQGKEALNEEEKKDVKQLEESLKQLDGKLANTSMGKALSVRESGNEVQPTYLLVRGDAHSPAQEVQPTFLSALGGQIPEIRKHPVSDNLSKYGVQSTSGRRHALADWMVDPKNPLTARVMANRLWHYHFGKGIVPTPSDFGQTGTAPTHPELLDYLAAELIRGGWQTKRLHRLIMTSWAYRQSSRAADDHAMEIDPDNRFLWRQNLHRLSGEAIRDAVLAVSGRLNSTMEGRGVFPTLSQEVLATQSISGNGWDKSSLAEQCRRSIYVFVKRTLRVPILEAFDVPTPDAPEPARPQTTISPQALILLNGSFMNQQAGDFASRLQSDFPGDSRAQVRRAYRLAFGREPDDEEMKTALNYLAWQGQQWTGQRQAKNEPTQEADASVYALKSFCRMLFNLPPHQNLWVNPGSGRAPRL